MRLLRSFLIIFCLLRGSLSTPVWAQQASFVYPNFASVSALNLNESAQVVTTSDGQVLELTPAAGGSAGSAFSNNQIRLGANDTFSTFFQFRLRNASFQPADGFVFVIQTVSSDIGGGGGG